MKLGISDYTKIKTPERARIGLPRESTAELNWIHKQYLSGKENDAFSQKSIYDQEKLRSLDCLGVSEKQDKPDDYVYGTFKEQTGLGHGEY